MAGSKTKKKTGGEAKDHASHAAKKAPPKKKPATKPASEHATKPAVKEKPAAKKKPATKPAVKKERATKAKATRSSTTKASSTKAKATKKSMPAALVKRAEAEVAAKRAHLAKDARDDIDLILRRRERIAEDFWDIGEALVRLKRPGIAEALGRASFREVCEKDLSMSLSAAEALIKIVTGVRREDAVRMGQERALALVRLAQVTPEADTAAQLATAKKKLPSGRVLDIAKASANEIKAATKLLRSASANGRPAKGRTTSADDRAIAAKLQSALHASGVELARVTAVATKPGQQANLRIERVPMSAIAVLHRVLGEHVRRS